MRNPCYQEMTACSLVLPENPLAEYVELPANLTNRLRLGFRQQMAVVGGQFLACLIGGAPDLLDCP